MVAQPMGPVYNNLIIFDPHNYPEIIGDLAKSWTVSDDHLSYTFTLHQGVKLHDGSEPHIGRCQGQLGSDTSFHLTGKQPPAVKLSDGQKHRSLDRATVVFHLHHPLAVVPVEYGSSRQFHLRQENLDADSRQYYKTHTVGTGPFKLKNYTRGSIIELERNLDYWKKGLPYLDGIKNFPSSPTPRQGPKPSAQDASISSCAISLRRGGWHHRADGR